MDAKKIVTVRGVEVEVTATAFEGDPSVGIAYGPEQVYATTLDGEPFELTEEEELNYIELFSEWYPNDSILEDFDCLQARL